MPSFPGPIDLHTHSSVSDGTETPAELMRSAAAAGIGVVALTDHDSTSGWDEASLAVSRTGVSLVPGMELSTRVQFASVHLLGYLFDPSEPALMAETERIRVARFSRAEEIVRRIARDYDITWDDVLAQTTPDATVGRPHIADALVARGLAPDRSAAFAGILHWRSGYYQPHYAPDPLTGVRIIRGPGSARPGTSWHPGSGIRDSPERLEALVDAGLFGLEIDHRENTPDARRRLHLLAKRFGLAVTGSSDYHGDGKPNRLGEHTTDPAVLDGIVAEATGSTPIVA